MKHFRAFIKEPGKRGCMTFVKNDLKELQEIVGGYIETVRIDPDTVMIVNEEGKLLGLPFNFPTDFDVIQGTAILIGVDGEEFSHLIWRSSECHEFVGEEA